MTYCASLFALQSPKGLAELDQTTWLKVQSLSCWQVSPFCEFQAQILLQIPALVVESWLRPRPCRGESPELLEALRWVPFHRGGMYG